MAERVREPEPGKHWKNPPVRLASLRRALPVVVQMLAGVGGDGFRDGERFQQSQEGNGQRTA
jgi:hypothetical protein